MSEFYVAVLARNAEGEIFATLPDLPGVNSAGATRAEALAIAVELANDYVRDLVEEGHEVPVARDIDDISVEEEDQEIGRALVPVEIPGKTVKVSISMDEALLKRIDRAAESVGLTRSGYIASAAENRIRAAARNLPSGIHEVTRKTGARDLAADLSQRAIGETLYSGGPEVLSIGGRLFVPAPLHVIDEDVLRSRHAAGYHVDVVPRLKHGLALRRTNVVRGDEGSRKRQGRNKTK
jgi:predicted RNase H-like HicB family nuclease